MEKKFKSFLLHLTNEELLELFSSIVSLPPYFVSYDKDVIRSYFRYMLLQASHESIMDELHDTKG